MPENRPLNPLSTPGVSYCSTLKVHRLTAEQYRCRTGKKRGVRSHNRQVTVNVNVEHEMVEGVYRRAEFRRAMRTQDGLGCDGLTVWNDSDPDTGRIYPTNKHRLPKWRSLTEYMKLQIAGMAATEFRAYSFTARLNPELEKQFIQRDYDFFDRIKRRIAKEFNKRGISAPMAYLLEGKTRKKTKTVIHLHGLFLAEDPVLCSSIKGALECALKAGVFRQKQSPKDRPSRDVKVKRYYDKGMQQGKLFGRWQRYGSKNLMLPDERLPGKRIFINHEMVQIARSFWGLITEARFGKE